MASEVLIEEAQNMGQWRNPVAVGFQKQLMVGAQYPDGLTGLALYMTRSFQLFAKPVLPGCSDGYRFSGRQ